MVFTSFHFLLFFAVTIILGHLLKNKWQKLFFLAASYYFYGSFEPYYLILILVSTSWDFLCGMGIAASTQKKEGLPVTYPQILSKISGKAWLTSSVLINMGILSYFKYTNFGIEILNDTIPQGNTLLSWPAENILLPAGVSFFTFQSLSYTVDVYRKQIDARRSFLDYAVFVSFFPQLVAGPIVRGTVFFKELDERLPVLHSDIVIGFSRIVVGFFRKLVLSDNLAPIVNQVFSQPQNYHPVDVWIAGLAFGFQIYLDFAGYTDIARGVARLFGFEFQVNFLYPMAAKSIEDHWNRWHLSLTTWLRDYIYIPLGGSRAGQFRMYINIFAVWLFGGVWHGPAYHFIAWGIWQYVMIVIHRNYKNTKVAEYLRSKGLIYDIAARVLTFAGLNLGFIWFRADNMKIATIMHGRLIGIENLYSCFETACSISGNFPAPKHIKDYGILIGLYFFYDIFFNKFKLDYWRRPEQKIKFAFILSVMVLCILTLTPPETPQFIYFQF